MAIDDLKRIRNARVYDVARETELDAAPVLSARIGNTVLLKREDNQPVFSFEPRGAYAAWCGSTTTTSGRAAGSRRRPAIARGAWRSPQSGSAAARRS